MQSIFILYSIQHIIYHKGYISKEKFILNTMKLAGINRYRGSRKLQSPNYIYIRLNITKSPTRTYEIFLYKSREAENL